MADSIEILKRNNPGVYIEERDFSVFNITQFYNQINLVVGCSKEGPFNLPVVVVSPENFEQIFGKQDYNLERKGSYFHRTVNNMLQSGPVMCVNLRLTDRDLDQYNWINISTSSDTYNSTNRTNPVEDFYNRSDGFWRRSVEQTINVVNQSVPDAHSKPLTLVNQGKQTISLLLYKSTLAGFDIPLEDWYGGGKVPSYLHPKDLASDYMITILAIEGRWNEYDKLSVDPKWNKYFSKSGIRREFIEQYLNEPEVKLVRRWTGSLIPYFQDKTGKDIYIASVVNDDVNETGILMAYNNDIIETDFRNGLIDILGDNLSSNPKPQIDFLSYKRNLSDLYLIEEKFIDQPNNSFGNHLFNIGNRTQYYAEGYVHGAKLKPLIINTTSSLYVKPLDCSDDDDSYAIINGVKISLNNDIEKVISLPEHLSPGTHMAFVIYVDSDGVKFKISEKQPVWQKLFLPIINPETEMVLGYYRVWQDIQTEIYHAELHGVTIDDNGFIDPFRKSDEVGSKINIIDLNQVWQQKLYFENISKLNFQDYDSMRIYHLWYWLSNNLKERESLIIDVDGNKQLIEWIQSGQDDSGKWIIIATENKNVNIQDVNGTSGTTGLVSLYMSDIEFLPQTETKWSEKIEPYAQGSDGIIGDDSLIYDSYVRGEINSGDPFFWGLGEEENIRFTTDGIHNYLIIPEGASNNYIGKKIVVYGSEKNDGIFTVLNSTYINGEYALYLKEAITQETCNLIKIFDADTPKIINLYFVNSKLKAKVENYEGDAEELYRRIFLKEDAAQWNKTLEIEQTINSNTILVKAQFAKGLREGYYLLAQKKPLSDDGSEKVRNWTRIIDVVRWAGDEELLMVETDSAIELKDVDGDLQTEMLIPIDVWVNTLDFKVLEPYKVRKEVLPDGTEQKLNDILNIISKNSQMAKSLCAERMEWRYLIDSFGLGLSPNSKEQLAQLCARKQLAMGFLNMPSIKQLRNSSKTIFNKDGVLDTKLLLKGGSRTNSAELKFGLTSEGKSHVMYITPYVVVDDPKLGRKTEVPPSSYVADLYMKKHNDTRFRPWDIIAGSKHKMNSIAGLETTFNPDQLADLDRMRLTAITSYQNFIFYLNSENTAESSDSLLGYVHNREALIELESTLKAELNNYQWSEHTQETIDKIVEAANNICLRFKKLDAISDYVNEFESNPELIDAQIGILNTYVELVAGMGRILLRVNIFATGGLSNL